MGTHADHMKRGKKTVTALTSGGRELAIREICLYCKLRGTAYGNSAGIMDSKASIEKNMQVKEQIQPVELIQDSNTVCHNSNILGNKTQ